MAKTKKCRHTELAEQRQSEAYDNEAVRTARTRGFAAGYKSEDGVRGLNPYTPDSASAQAWAKGWCGGIVTQRRHNAGG